MNRPSSLPKHAGRKGILPLQRRAVGRERLQDVIAPALAARKPSVVSCQFLIKEARNEYSRQTRETMTSPSVRDRAPGNKS